MNDHPIEPNGSRRLEVRRSRRRPKSSRRGFGLLFWFGALLVLASIVVFGAVLRDAATLAIAAPTILVLTMLTQLDRLRRIKGAGFEAELIAEAREVTKEAQATLVDLRGVALALSSVSLEALSNAGRLGGDPKGQQRFAHEVRATLRRIGCRKADIDNIMSNVVAKWRYDLASSAINAMMRAVQVKHDDPGLNKPETKQPRELLLAMSGGTFADAPPPSRLRALAEKYGLDSSEVEQALVAYEDFKP